MGRQSKVEKIGWPCESLVAEMDAEGKSKRKIAEEVEERFDTEISHNSIANYLNEHQDKKLARMKDEQRRELAQKRTEKIIEVNDKVETMEDKLDTILETTLDEANKEDVDKILRVMKEVRSLMEFQKEYVEQVTQPETQINNVEITNNTAIQLSEKLMEYEEKGIITIHEPNKLQK